MPQSQTSSITAHAAAPIESTGVAHGDGSSKLLFQQHAPPHVSDVPPHAYDTQDLLQTLLRTSVDEDEDDGSRGGAGVTYDNGVCNDGMVTVTTMGQEICLPTGDRLTLVLDGEEAPTTPPRAVLAVTAPLTATSSDVADDGFRTVPLHKGQWMVSSNVRTTHVVDATPPTWTNSFAILDMDHGMESPVPQLTRTLPFGSIETLLSLKDVVTSSFQKIFGDTMEETPLRYKGIFEEGAEALDGVLTGLQADETHHWAWLDQ
jgi:hypothetical protein